MPKPILNTALTKALVIAALVLATTSANAQRSMEERRNRQSSENSEASAGKQEAQYPDATREEPDVKASAKMGTKLQKLVEAYNENDYEAVKPLAAEIIAAENANAYDKALSARILGASLVGTDDAAAMVAFNQALEFNGLGNNDHFEVMYIIAQLQAQGDDFAAANATLDRLMQETNTQKAEHLGLKGMVLFQMERYPEAITALKAASAATAEPKPEWTQLLMASYSETGQTAEAAQLAEQIASSAPTDKRSQLNLAATYLQGEQYDKAAEVYERLRAAGELTEDRDYRNLMALYINAGEKEKEAIAVINEGLEKGVLKPDHNTYVALAQAYYFSDQGGQAIEAYRKAAPLAPDGETYLNLAKALWSEGRNAEAKQAAQQALDKGIKSPQEARTILSQGG